jgi:hypothetical protein
VIYFSLAACLALAVFFAVNLVASLLATLVWRVAERGLHRVRPRTRAGSLFLLRLLPVGAALVVVGGVFIPAFCAFEPRETRERVAISLLVLAAIGIALIAGGAARAWRASRITRQLIGEWLKTAQPVHVPGAAIEVFGVEADFPVVSVEGIVRPRLFISQRVLAECTPDELAAMIRHECGHVASADNLKRLAFRLVLDPLSFTRVGRDLEQAWHDASEDVADDYTVTGSPRSALALAHALVRVARMVPSGSAAVPLTSLYRGTGVERRVRRLLGSEPSTSGRPAWVLAVRALLMLPPVLTLTVLLDWHLLRGVHGLIEVVVKSLP